MRQSGSLKSLFINSILFSKLDKPYFLCKRTSFEILKRLIHYSHTYTTYFTKAIKMWCHLLYFSATACGDSSKSRRIHANACYHHHAYTAGKGRGLQNCCWSNKQRSKPHIWHLDLGTSSMTDFWKAEILPFFSLHQFMVRMPTLQHQSSCFKDPLKDYTHTGFLPTDTGGFCPEGSPWSDLSYESVVEQLPVDLGKSHTMDPCATCPPSKYPQWRQWSPITVNPKQCDSRA